MNVFTHTNRTGARLLAILAVFSLLVSLMPTQAFAQSVGPSDNDLNPNVDICHATGSSSNPYSDGVQEVDANSIVYGQNAHSAHDDGGLDDKGDIIAPFLYGNPENPTQFPGQNWTFVFSNGMTGQEISENGCETENDPVTGTITVIKQLAGDVPEDVTKDDFSFKVNNATAIDFNAGGSVTLNDQEVGSYDIVEVEANGDGYTTTHSAGCDAELAKDATLTCTITNTYEEVVEPCDQGYKRNEAGQCVPIENPQYADVTLCKVGGTGVPMTGWELFLKQGDDSFKNGLTAGETGCLVLDNVLYGSYTVDETMKSEFWDNVADADGVVAKGAQVVIDSETEKFTLMNREAEHCDDENALNNGKRGKCEYPEEGNEVITACKYQVWEDEEGSESLAGWEMTFTNNKDGEGEVTKVATTTANGCVSVEVDPEDGPFYVYEEMPEDWTQDDVTATGGSAEDGEGGEFCKFFAPTILDRVLSFASVNTTPTHRCDFYNMEDEEDVPQCTNLLVNGSFESPALEADGYQIINTVTGWVRSLSDGVEVWRNFNGNGAGLASDGVQNIEMDGNDATKISQAVTTVAGATYELKFDFSPRAGTALADNSVDAAANGTLVTNVTGDGSANGTNVWTTHAGTFVAAGTSTDISFEDKGVANDNGGLGALIDNARLCLVRDPQPAPVCTVNVMSDTSNTVTEKSGANALVITNANQPGSWVDNIASSLAQWIWGSPALSTIDGVNNETQTFVKTFTWNGPVTSAALKVSADNTYTVKLNGIAVGGDANIDNFTTTDTIDLSGSIAQGTNTLEIAVTNVANGLTTIEGNPAGLLYDLTVVGNNTIDCTKAPGGGDNDELSCQLTASDTSIRRGNGVVLNWTTNNAVSAHVTTIGDLASTSLPSGGDEVAEVNADTTFVMTVMDKNEHEATCSVAIDTTSGGGGGGGSRRNNDDGDVAGDSSSRPQGQVLGEQVSVVPLGAADAGAGGAAPIALPNFGLAAAALLARTRK